MKKEKFRLKDVILLWKDAIVASVLRKYGILSVEKLKKMIDCGKCVTIVDCRSSDMFESAHIPGAMSLPYDKFMLNFSSIPSDGVVVTVCYVGMFSRVAAQKLCDSGYLKVFSLAGGMKRWGKVFGRLDGLTRNRGGQA